MTLGQTESNGPKSHLWPSPCSEASKNSSLVLAVWSINFSQHSQCSSERLGGHLKDLVVDHTAAVESAGTPLFNFFELKCNCNIPIHWERGDSAVFKVRKRASVKPHHPINCSSPWFHDVSICSNTNGHVATFVRFLGDVMQHKLMPVQRLSTFSQPLLEPEFAWNKIDAVVVRLSKFEANEEIRNEAASGCICWLQTSPGFGG